MRIDWWTLGLQAVNLLVLVWILHRFLFRPITAMIAARQKAVAGLLDDAAARKAEAEAEREKAEAEAAATAAARREILETAAAEAAQHTEALLAEAKVAADERRAANDAALAAARESATAKIHRQAGRLAVDIAGCSTACRPRHGSPASSTDWRRRSPNCRTPPGTASARMGRR